MTFELTVFSLSLIESIIEVLYKIFWSIIVVFIATTGLACLIYSAELNFGFVSVLFSWDLSLLRVEVAVKVIKISLRLGKSLSHGFDGVLASTYANKLQKTQLLRVDASWQINPLPFSVKSAQHHDLSDKCTPSNSALPPSPLVCLQLVMKSRAPKEHGQLKTENWAQMVQSLETSLVISSVNMCLLQAQGPGPPGAGWPTLDQKLLRGRTRADMKSPCAIPVGISADDWTSIGLLLRVPWGALTIL